MASSIASMAHQRDVQATFGGGMARWRVMISK